MYQRKYKVKGLLILSSGIEKRFDETVSVTSPSKYADDEDLKYIKEAINKKYVYCFKDMHLDIIEIVIFLSSLYFI